MTEATICIENPSLKDLENEFGLNYKLNAKEPYVLFKDYVNYFCHACFRILYVCLGVLQFFAIKDAFIQVLHFDNVVTPVISFVLAFVPVLGPILGLWGACLSWGWSTSFAVIVFILPYIFVHSPLFMVTLMDVFKDWRRWKMEEKI